MQTFMIPPGIVKLAALLAPLVAISTASTIASFSFLQAPILRSIAKDDPVTHCLRDVRWYFETGKLALRSKDRSDYAGKYIFPPLALVSGALFSFLAYAHPVKRGGFVGATIGCLSILPFTTMYMIPTVNNKILALDDKAKARKTEEVEVKRLQVSELLERFRQRDLVRGGLFWAGGAIGLYSLLL